MTSHDTLDEFAANSNLSALYQFKFSHPLVETGSGVAHITNVYTSGDSLLNQMKEYGVTLSKDKLVVKDVSFKELEFSEMSVSDPLIPYDAPYGTDVAEVMRPELFGRNPYYSKFLDTLFFIEPIRNVGQLLKLDEMMKDAIRIVTNDVTKLEKC